MEEGSSKILECSLCSVIGTFLYLILRVFVSPSGSILCFCEICDQLLNAFVLRKTNWTDLIVWKALSRVL